MKRKLLVAIPLLAMVGSLAIFFIVPQPQATGRYSLTECAPLVLKVADSKVRGGFIDAYPASVSYKFELWHTQHPGIPADTSKTPDKRFYICNELVVNDGLDILASLDGQNKTGSPVYMIASTSAGGSATDTTCAGGQTTNGFTRQNTAGTYAHTTGTATYTIFGQWTYTSASSTTIAGACLVQHSVDADGTGAAGATHVLVDATATSATATVNSNGDILKITATITV